MSPKECFQLQYPKRQTRCFYEVKDPCSDSNCRLEKLADRLSPIKDWNLPVFLTLMGPSLHLRCAMSYFSRHNQEFRDRMVNNQKKLMEKTN
jgi:hypothetical protein